MFKSIISELPDNELPELKYFTRLREEKGEDLNDILHLFPKLREELPKDSKPVSIPKRDTKKKSTITYTDDDMFKDQKTFVNTMYQRYIDRGVKSDIAKILSVQKLLESASKYGGFSYLATEGYNFGGIKAREDSPYLTCKTDEYINGNKETITDRFRKFSSLDEYLDYEKHLYTKGNFKGALTGNVDHYFSTINGDFNGGLKYATAPNYRSYLENMVKQYFPNKIDYLAKKLKGGRIEKASLGTIFSTDKPRDQRRSSVGVLKNDYYGEDMYDYSSSPIIPDDGHWPSRGDNGVLLKNSNHPTSFHEYEQSKERGLSLYEDRNGREYTLEEWQVNMPEYLLKGLKKKPYPSYRDDRSHYSYIDKNYNKIKYMWDELLSAGASPEQAAAILGNFYQESKLDYSTIRKGNGARGLAQLLEGRKAAYEEYLSLNPDLVDSTETQIKYLIPIIFGNESNPHGLKDLYRYDIKKDVTKYLPYDSYGIEWNKSQRSAFRNAKTLDDMVVAFENNFERAKGDSMDIRKLAARYIYKIMNK